jgi:hypothetical protein
MKYIYIITNGRSPHIFGVFTDLSELQLWMVQSKNFSRDLEVWRFVDGNPDVKVDRIQWNSGEVIE